MARRTFLLAGASAVGVGTLAACASGGSAPADEQPADGGPGGGEPAVLVALADVPVGGAVLVRTGAGEEVVVAQPQEGTVVAFSAICTHMGCTVAPDGAQLACPCHGSVFESATGAVVEGPAEEPLPSVVVTVQDGQVLEG